MKTKTVYLIEPDKSYRADLFKKFIEDYKEFSIVETQRTKLADYNVIFNLEGLGSSELEILNSILEFSDSDTFTVFDISNEYFMESPEADYYVLLAAAASFVTCSSEFIQEMLYEQTGRVAYLIADPISTQDLDKSVSSLSNPPEILWYGEVKDIMSIRPFLTHNKFDIKIATPTVVSYTKDRARTTVLLNDKKKQKVFEETDIIFLPPTHNRDGEIRRFRKVEEAVKKGKLVVAPDLQFDWDCLAYDGSLNKALKYFKSLDDIPSYIKENQELLLTKYSEEASKEALKAALFLVPEEIYQNDLDYFLASI